MSRAEAVRQALSVLLESDATRQGAIAATVGLWSARVADGLEYQEAIRAEWGER